MLHLNTLIIIQLPPLVLNPQATFDSQFGEGTRLHPTGPLINKNHKSQ